MHDTANFTETVFDQRGNPTTYVYDDLGNVVQQEGPEGGITKWTYDDPAHPTRETTETVVLADGTELTTAFTYNTFGDMASESHPLGNVSRFTYKRVQPINLSILAQTGVQVPAGLPYSVPATTTDPLGNTTTNTYTNTTGRLTSMTDPSGQNTAPLDTTL